MLPTISRQNEFYHNSFFYIPYNLRHNTFKRKKNRFLKLKIKKNKIRKKYLQNIQINSPQPNTA